MPEQVLIRAERRGVEDGRVHVHINGWSKTAEIWVPASAIFEEPTPTRERLIEIIQQITQRRDSDVISNMWEHCVDLRKKAPELEQLLPTRRQLRIAELREELAQLEAEENG